ncbi:hypothetical protein M408DRAFT_264718 [Serendipita vermifera MAFF 305830]|uniref:Uncharacterized protein n=1 Tax=Serendipita vermifera MAFF 305830 TaxID=933852 RepID=A0A0C2W9X8_SERVB|nr:hypothetical protein M408DRAFT_264718 [Serendipita vermifera MAFF 305830]
MQLNYGERTVLTAWNGDYEYFLENARHLCEIPQSTKVRLYARLAVFGGQEIEVDPKIWSTLEREITGVSLKEIVPVKVSLPEVIPEEAPPYSELGTVTAEVKSAAVKQAFELEEKLSAPDHDRPPPSPVHVVSGPKETLPSPKALASNVPHAG